MQIGDIEKLQKYVAKEYKIEECRMEFLRTVESLKAKIDEVEKKASESTQLDQVFYEANRQKLKQVQKHLNILTEVAEKLRVENFQNFDPVKRNLLTTYNRQAHRFNMLIPEQVKARMKKSKLFSKLMVKDDDEEAKEESEEKKENQEFEEIIQKLSFYLSEDDSFSGETGTNVIIGEKEQSEVIYVKDKQESSDYEEQIKKQKAQSLKKIQQQAEKRLSDQQKKARKEYKWFLRRENATMSLKYVCLCAFIFILLLIGIGYLLLRKAYQHYGEL